MGDKHSKLFNIIAPIYAMFYSFQVKYFQKTLDKIKSTIDLIQYKTILDVGCCTGALCYVLHEKGLEVTGVDAAENMIEKSQKNLKGSRVKLFTMLS